MPLNLVEKALYKWIIIIFIIIINYYYYYDDDDDDDDDDVFTCVLFNLRCGVVWTKKGYFHYLIPVQRRCSS